MVRAACIKALEGQLSMRGYEAAGVLQLHATKDERVFFEELQTQQGCCSSRPNIEFSWHHCPACPLAGQPLPLGVEVGRRILGGATPGKGGWLLGGRVIGVVGGQEPPSTLMHLEPW